MLESNRTVVAAVRDEGKARDVLPSSERLLVRSGVDVTDPSTFSDDLWEGVTQVVSAVGPTFSRTEQGPKYALSLFSMLSQSCSAEQHVAARQRPWQWWGTIS